MSASASLRLFLAPFTPSSATARRSKSLVNLGGAAILKAYLDRGDKVDVAVPRMRGPRNLGSFLSRGWSPDFVTEPINNMPFRFWFWGRDGEMRARYLLDTENRSAVVVVEATDKDPRYKIEERRLGSEGYRRERVICAQIYFPDMKSSPYNNSSPLCHAFYEPQNRGRPLANDHCRDYPGI